MAANHARAVKYVNRLYKGKMVAKIKKCDLYKIRHKLNCIYPPTGSITSLILTHDEFKADASTN